MGQTLTVRLDRRLAKWLEQEATNSGLTQGQIVRELLLKAKASSAPPFMRLAGAIRGPRNLSKRTAFAKQTTTTSDHDAHKRRAKSLA